jgi:DNA modification methylase
MADFPDNSIDLVITSPPYWTAVSYDGRQRTFPGQRERLKPSSRATPKDISNDRAPSRALLAVSLYLIPDSRMTRPYSIYCFRK